MALTPTGVPIGSRVATSPVEVGGSVESSHSAVTWSAVLGGAFVAAAVTLILLILGSGFGLSAVSPYSGSNPSAGAFTAGAAAWLVFVLWISSGLGGYLTGRLRTKWSNMHGDEVFFRDTAHGFLSWAVATVIGVVFLASAATSIVGGAAHSVSTVLGGAAQGATQAAGQQAGQNSGAGEATGYFVDSLFRSPNPDPNANAADVRAETTRILANSAANGEVSPADKAYLSQLVAQRTGLSQPDAQKRVDDVLGQVNAAKEKAKKAADEARKAASAAAMGSFLALLIGAFIASAAAALGGRHRDEI
ncbi:hypothetical protein SAMN05216548_104146 [Faunimonas pinastri]|uniref:Uncharacterized protein n=1 Tax=Faunimonas pinastri TaxID=1855383 RepID=A0A1H9FKX8_9HYPH|nr:hypothetical protein [Faunimonas pinastri]SEQ38519.1 hypothetical protein SAMN05216548_104146 [Faunimonas pinastri]